MTIYNNKQISREIRKIFNQYFEEGYEIKLSDSNNSDLLNIELFNGNINIRIIINYQNTYVEDVFLKKIVIEIKDKNSQYKTLKIFYSIDNMRNYLFNDKEPEKWTTDPNYAVQAEKIRKKRRIQKLKKEGVKLSNISKKLLKLIRKHKGFSNVKADELIIERKPKYYFIAKKNPKRAGQFININFPNKEEIE